MVAPAELRARRTRSDAFPEWADYRDDGCELAPSCLACPLPVCKEDVGGARMLHNYMRAIRIYAFRDAGGTINDIAWAERVSRRTVFRVLEGRPS